jgi:hypothetical protein
MLVIALERPKGKLKDIIKKGKGKKGKTLHMVNRE